VAPSVAPETDPAPISAPMEKPPTSPLWLVESLSRCGAPEGTRTPNLLIRSSRQLGCFRLSTRSAVLRRLDLGRCGRLGCCTSVLYRHSPDPRIKSAAGVGQSARLGCTKLFDDVHARSRSMASVAVTVAVTWDFHAAPVLSRAYGYESATVAARKAFRCAISRRR
jgi:hypothetical protein